MTDILPKSATRPKLVPARHYLRYNHTVRFRDEGNLAARMFDLGSDYRFEIAACTDETSMAMAFGMLEAIGNGKDPRGPLWCVYVMEAENSGFSKIGVSQKPVDRVSQIQSSNPHRITLYAAVFSSIVKATDIESGVLKKAAQEGWRACGEWVRATPEQLLVEIFDFAKRECHAICDPLTWFEDMKASTLRRASQMRRYRNRI